MSERKQLNEGRGTVNDTHRHNNLDVLKPFLKFGVGAMSAIAHTLIGIVKSIPKPHQDDRPKHDKIVLKR